MSHAIKKHIPKKHAEVKNQLEASINAYVAMATTLFDDNKISNDYRVDVLDQCEKARLWLQDNANASIEEIVQKLQDFGKKMETFDKLVSQVYPSTSKNQSGETK